MPCFRWLAATCATTLLASCASTPIEEPATTPTPTRPAAPTPPPETAAPRTVAPVTAPTLDPLSDPASPLAQRSVFFDFDEYVVKPEHAKMLEAHGKYLAQNKQRRIAIEGHADERGGREYNLALGQRRADAVKSRLLLLGAASEQIETVSLGEERPRATGHDEQSWAQNRRADIVYR